MFVFTFVVGCSPPSPPSNGRITEHSSGAVGAMLTFQCDAGYLPQAEVISTCLHSDFWVPIPHCEGIYIHFHGSYVSFR